MREIIYHGILYRWHRGALLSRNQAQYALEQLWRLSAGASSWGGLPVIEIPAIDRARVEDMLSLERGELPWILLKHILPRDVKLPLDTDTLPALCKVENRDTYYYDGTGLFPLDLVAATFIMLSRWEEAENPSIKDEWGNYPASATLADRQGFTERPILDEWALVLQAWLERKVPTWRVGPTHFRLRMTHDIDHPYQFPSWYCVARATGGAILRDRSTSKAVKTFIQGVRSRFNESSDPFCQGLYTIMGLDEELGVRGTFFLMTADPGRFDEGYDLSSPRYRRLLEDVLDRGHEVGWHPSYRSSHDEESFLCEKERMDDLMDGIRYGARFHYLQWTICRSWKRLADVGCLYDASMGFNETVGFRCGTAQPFPVFDLGTQALLDLEERPFMIQDNALFHCMSLHYDEAVEKVRVLLERVKAVEGELTVIIHNSKQETEDNASSFFRECLSKEFINV